MAPTSGFEPETSPLQVEVCLLSIISQITFLLALLPIELCRVFVVDRKRIELFSLPCKGRIIPSILTAHIKTHWYFPLCGAGSLWLWPHSNTNQCVLIWCPRSDSNRHDSRSKRDTSYQLGYLGLYLIIYSVCL